MKPSRIWRAFEAAPGLIRSSADWRRLLGQDYAKLHPHLRPRQGLAGSILCPSKPRCGCLHGVVEHKRDDLVSVCRCFPRRCRTAPLERADAVVYELHRAGLGGALAGALGIKPGERILRGMHATWQIGTYIPQAGLRIPFYLSVQSDPEDFKSVVTSLAASDPGPFVLLAPTEDFWKPEYYDLLRAKKALFLALNEVMDWNGKLTAKQPVQQFLHDLLAQLSPSAMEETVFRREGDAWRVVFEGATVSLRHSMGLACISHLLHNPNQDIPAAVLQASAAGTLAPSKGAAVESHDADSEDNHADRSRSGTIQAGAHLDQRALKEYKTRMEDIEEQLREAETNNDNGRVASLKRELNQLSQEVGRATGLGGKLRRNDDSERSRKAVSNAIHRAFTAVKKAHPALEKHLRRSITVAEVLSYRPEKPVAWAA